MDLEGGAVGVGLGPDDRRPGRGRRRGGRRLGEIVTSARRLGDAVGHVRTTATAGTLPGADRLDGEVAVQLDDRLVAVGDGDVDLERRAVGVGLGAHEIGARRRGEGGGGGLGEVVAGERRLRGPGGGRRRGIRGSGRRGGGRRDRSRAVGGAGSAARREQASCATGEEAATLRQHGTSDLVPRIGDRPR